MAVTSGGFIWRRIGNQVFQKMYGSWIEWSAQAGDVIIPPEGFRPSGGEIWRWQGYDSRQTSWIISSGSGTFSSGQSGTVFNQNYVYTSTTWLTDEAWPTVLPGTAV